MIPVMLSAPHILSHHVTNLHELIQRQYELHCRDKEKTETLPPTPTSARQKRIKAQVVGLWLLISIISSLFPRGVHTSLGEGPERR